MKVLKNMKLKRMIALAIVFVMVLTALSACGTKKNANQDDSVSEESISEEAADEGLVDEDLVDDSSDADNASVSTSSSSFETVSVSSVPEGFSERDFDYSYQNALNISLADNGSKVSGSGAEVDGNTITITKEGTYIITGTLSEGQIVIDLPGENDKVQLVLDNVSITNSSSAALYVKNADKVFVTTTEGSVNNVSSTGSFVQTDDNNVDGAIYSKDDIVFNGMGTLNVISQEGHGIVSKNDLKITSGTYSIQSAKKGLQGKDMVGIAGGDITIDADGDGISSVYAVLYDGDIKINAGDDGINVKENDENNLPIITLAGGTLTIDSGDDGIQTTGELELLGTKINIVSGGGYENAAEHYGDMMFGQMGGWGGMGQGGPAFG